MMINYPEQTLIQKMKSISINGKMTSMQQFDYAFFTLIGTLQKGFEGSLYKRHCCEKVGCLMLKSDSSFVYESVLIVLKDTKWLESFFVVPAFPVKSASLRINMRPSPIRKAFLNVY